MEQYEPGLSAAFYYLNEEAVEGAAFGVEGASGGIEKLVVEGFEGFVANKEEGVFEVVSVPDNLRPIALSAGLLEEWREVGQFFYDHL